MFFETQWDEYLKKVQTELKGSFYQHKASPLVFLNDLNMYIGDHTAFEAFVLEQFRYVDNSKMLIYNKMANKSWKTAV